MLADLLVLLPVADLVLLAAVVGDLRGAQQQAATAGSRKPDIVGVTSTQATSEMLWRTQSDLRKRQLKFNCQIFAEREGIVSHT